MSSIKVIDKRQSRQLKVAAYCRVSTSQEAQLESLSNQRGHYEKLINSNSDWMFAGVYYDEGISGTTIDRRESFQQMIKDAVDGKIEFIITKSISRFARNTVDCLETCRLLAEHKVYIFFEKERINTKDLQTEFLLSIMSAFAENESVSISQNMKWSIKKRFKEGTYKVLPPYGYTSRNGQLIVDSKKAEIVKRIYAMYLSGKGVYTIAKVLNEERIPGPRGNRWHYTTVGTILKRLDYTGDHLYQQTYTDEHFKKHKNKGELPMLHHAEHHEAIISKEDFQRVQDRFEYNSNGRNGDSSRRYALSRLIKCGECGGNFFHKTQTTGSNTYPIFACRTHILSKDKCSMKSIKEVLLKRAFCIMFNKLQALQKKVLKRLLPEIENLNAVETSEITDKLRELDNKEKTFIEMRDKYNIDSGLINKELKLIDLKRKNLSAGIGDFSPDRLEEYKEMLRVLDNTKSMTEFSEELFLSLVEYVTVQSPKQVRFTLKSGLSFEERIR